MRCRLLMGLLPCILAACAPTTGDLGTDLYNTQQAQICQHVATFAADFGWRHFQQGASLEAVLDAIDTYYAQRPSATNASAARQVRYAVEVVYANPQWTQPQARVGAEQACRRATMY